jgi:hypothetical protein
VNLSGSKLKEASLIRASLSGANLSRANLSRSNVAKRQLAECRRLKGATMPNGQKYEDWLGRRDGQDWLRKYKKDLGEKR